MAKLKKSEAFTVEREKEIQQVSKSCIYALLLMTYFVFQMDLEPFCCLLLQVVESVNELAQIMKDLSVLVIDQVSRYPPVRKLTNFLFNIFYSLTSSIHREPSSIEQTTTFRMLQPQLRMGLNSCRRSYLFLLFYLAVLILLSLFPYDNYLVYGTCRQRELRKKAVW